MAPNVDGETARLDSLPGQSRRILPEGAPPAQAWIENEDPNSTPGENKRLLPIPQRPQKPKSRLQAGLTLGVHSKYPSPKKRVRKRSQFQIRKEKLIAVLKPPYFIVSMIVLIVSIHLLGTCGLHDKLEWSPGVWRHEPWRLLTYGFLHATTTHLALNAIVALAIGWLLEREQGWWRIVIVWFSGVAAGALGAGVMQPGVRVVGASAAVYALLSAHLPNVCLRYGHIPLWWFRPLSVVVLGVSEACWALMRSPTVSGAASAHAQTSFEHVAWSAHAMGAAVAAPLAFLVFTGENEGKRYILALRVLSGLVLIAGVVAATLHYTLWYETEPT
ncbi:hypothetical protein K1T71_003611 [Dendrolimus kikuchii]|uniref:Uncharacterized protein n=1 Tax=Dendrolimus kikuchii TaxID=765133 RepID=A0ACC1D9G5_9NEOP|nr:hypothetical protein K1T71_003611 [Dendrolimus kikuchii]